MKSRIQALLLFVLAFGSSAKAAGPFVNLGFDEARTNNMRWFTATEGEGAASELLPGWQLLGVFPLGQVIETNIHLNANVSFFESSLIDRQFGGIDRYPVEGIYSFVTYPTIGLRTDILSQSGEIPADALSIRFKVFGDPWRLEINGVDTPVYGYVPGLPSDQSVEVSADVSAYAGQEVELSWITQDGPGFHHGLDSIRFSPEAVPEPGALPLLLAGGALGWAVRRRRRAAQR
jgi:hypothetical protein